MLDMIVGASIPRILALQAEGQPVPAAQNIRALIDTGASCSCIDPTVLGALGLQPTGKTPVITPITGEHAIETDTYDVCITIQPSDNQQPLTRAVISVCAIVLVHQGFHALLGRDILKDCYFTYNGSAKLFTLAY
jgi:predicted aspartyl protease